MKKTSILILIILITTVHAYSCCAEHIYRLFPIGELDNNVILVEFSLSRNCNMDGKEFEFWTKGTVNLVSSRGDSLEILQIVDTIDIIDCYCSYEDYYQKTIIESEITRSYLKALNKAKTYNGFTVAKLGNIEFNDTTNIKKYEERTDSSYTYIIRYKDLITIDIGLEFIISCAPDKVAEVREYKTTNYKITVIRMRCRLLDEQAIEHNRKRFVNIESAIWKEQAQWHGIAKDFMIIEPINR